MELILKNKYIYLPLSNNVVSNSASFTVSIMDELDLDMYNKVVNINGNQTPFDTDFVITKTHLSKPTINLSINLIHKETGEVLTYVADEYPVTRAFILGKTPSECYPSLVANLMERIDFNDLFDKETREIIKAMQQQIADLQTAVSKNTEDISDCNKAIIEISTEGEIV